MVQFFGWESVVENVFLDVLSFLGPCQRKKIRMNPVAERGLGYVSCTDSDFIYSTCEVGRLYRAAIFIHFP